jgi:hypothetical protein
MCKEVPLIAPENSPHAREWDGMTVETFKNQSLWTSSMFTYLLQYYLIVLSSIGGFQLC